MQAFAYAGHVFLSEADWLLPQQMFGVLNNKDATVNYVVFSGDVSSMPAYM